MFFDLKNHQKNLAHQDIINRDLPSKRLYNHRSKKFWSEAQYDYIKIPGYYLTVYNKYLDDVKYLEKRYYDFCLKSNNKCNEYKDKVYIYLNDYDFIVLNYYKNNQNKFIVIKYDADEHELSGLLDSQSYLNWAKSQSKKIIYLDADSELAKLYLKKDKLLYLCGKYELVLDFALKQKIEERSQFYKLKQTMGKTEHFIHFMNKIYIVESTYGKYIYAYVSNPYSSYQELKKIFWSPTNEEIKMEI